MKNVNINNTYNIGNISRANETTTNIKGGIVGKNEGTITLNKCYYLLTKDVSQAVHGAEDDIEKVTACKNVEEITPEILNNNIDSIEHEEEWKRWKIGENGYPIFVE